MAFFTLDALQELNTPKSAGALFPLHIVDCRLIRIDNIVRLICSYDCN